MEDKPKTTQELLLQLGEQARAVWAECWNNHPILRRLRWLAEKILGMLARKI